jgi:hypothetical protein
MSYNSPRPVASKRLCGSSAATTARMGRPFCKAVNENAPQYSWYTEDPEKRDQVKDVPKEIILILKSFFSG